MWGIAYGSCLYVFISYLCDKYPEKQIKGIFVLSCCFLGFREAKAEQNRFHDESGDVCISCLLLCSSCLILGALLSQPGRGLPLSWSSLYSPHTYTQSVCYNPAEVFLILSWWSSVLPVTSGIAKGGFFSLFLLLSIYFLCSTFIKCKINMSQTSNFKSLREKTSSEC